MSDTLAGCEGIWRSDIMPALCDYVRIPNVSSAYDPAWRENGHMMRAASLIHDWCASRRIEGS